MKINSYKNSWALITGASSGIGKEFAIQLAKKNINLLILARRENLLKDLKNELEKSFNVKVVIIVFDLSNIESFNILYERCKEYQVDILINNAGFGDLNEVVNQDEELLIKMINVNTTATVLLTKHFLQSMYDRKRGEIVMLGSVLSYFPSPFLSVYSATKVFNSFFGQGLIKEAKNYGVNVHILNPGSTDTDFHSIANNNKGLIVRTPQKVVTSFLSSNKNLFNDGFFNKFVIFISRFLSAKTVLRLTELFIRRNNGL